MLSIINANLKELQFAVSIALVLWSQLTKVSWNFFSYSSSPLNACYMLYVNHKNYVFTKFTK